MIPKCHLQWYGVNKVQDNYKLSTLASNDLSKITSAENITREILAYKRGDSVKNRGLYDIKAL